MAKVVKKEKAVWTPPWAKKAQDAKKTVAKKAVAKKKK